MKIGLMIVAAFFAGALVSFALCRSTIIRLRRRVRTLRAGGALDEKKKTETTKKVIWICLGNGFAWVWCSYILAYFDHPQIAESLSQAAVTEIIGVVLAYCSKAVSYTHLDVYKRQGVRRYGLRKYQRTRRFWAGA